jgi:hypothetical protein
LIDRFKATESWQREQGRFVPQMVNWLRGKRWLDALSPDEEQKIQQQEAFKEFDRKQQALADNNKAEGEKLRPLFEAYGAKFKNWTNIYAMACGTWRYLYSKGQAPSPSDVPDNNTLDIMAFMKAFQRKREEDAYRAVQVVRELQASNAIQHQTWEKREGSPLVCGDILQSGFLTRLFPQRESSLCVAV